MSPPYKRARGYHPERSFPLGAGEHFAQWYDRLSFQVEYAGPTPQLIKTSRTFSRFQLRKLVVANDGHRESIDESHIYIGRLDKASLDVISIKPESLAYNNAANPPSREKELVDDFFGTIAESGTRIVRKASRLA